MFLKRTHISLFLFCISILLFCFCTNQKRISRENKVILRHIEAPSFDWDENGFIELYTRDFPESISLFFAVGQKPFDIESAVLYEEVAGEIDTCAFTYKKFGSSENTNIIFLADVSASMGEQIKITDNIIWNYVSTLDNICEVALVRFGQVAMRTIDWTLPDSFLSFDPEKLEYPKDKGSDILSALDTALSLAHERRGTPIVIALFSDGDFSLDDFPDYLLGKLKDRGITVNVFMHGYSRKGILARIAHETKGAYIYKHTGAFSSKLVSASMGKSFRVSYRPAKNEKDGTLHRIYIEGVSGEKYRGEYRVQGVPRLPVVKRDSTQKAPTLPEEYTFTTRIYFNEIGNVEIVPEEYAVLDSVADAINSICGKQKLILKISGFTCNLGSMGVNARISRERALNVKNYLSKKIDSCIRFDVSWFGSQYPLNSNSDEAQRRENRRVELKLDLSKG